MTKRVFFLPLSLLILLSACGEDTTLNPDTPVPVAITGFTAGRLLLGKWTGTSLQVTTTGGTAGMSYHYELVSGNGILTGTDGPAAYFQANGNTGKVTIRASISNTNTLVDSRELCLYVEGSWSVVGTPGFGVVAKFQTIALQTNGDPLLVCQNRSGVYYGKAYTFSGSWSPFGGVSVSDTDEFLFSPSILINSTNIRIAFLNVAYAAFGVSRTLQGRVYYCDGSDWISSTPAFWSKVYSPSGPAAGIDNIKLLLNASNELTVIYRDNENSSRVMMQVFRDGNWTNHGDSTAVSGGETGALDAVSDSSGRIYAAWPDSSRGNRITVRRSTAGGWEAVGTAGFTSSATALSLALDPNGNPALVYVDSSSDHRLRALRYNGSEWDYPGTLITSGPATEPKLIFNTDGAAVIAWKSTADGGRLFAVCCYGPDWSRGNPVRLSLGEGNYPSLAVDSTGGSVYLAFQDTGYSSKTVVKRFQ